VSPEDLEQLVALDDVDLGDRLPPTELARKAHRLEDEPGAPVEDPELLAVLLGS
jgi:hypothetical protein